MAIVEKARFLTSLFSFSFFFFLSLLFSFTSSFSSFFIFFFVFWIKGTRGFAMIYSLSHVGMLLNGKFGFHFSFQAVHAAILGSRSHCQREPIKDSYVKIKATPSAWLSDYAHLELPHMELYYSCNLVRPATRAAGESSDVIIYWFL